MGWAMPNSHSNYITMLIVLTDNLKIKDNRLQLAWLVEM